MQKICTVCLTQFEGHKHKKTCSSNCAHRAQGDAVRQKMIDDNPMKRIDVAKRMSQTRSKRFKNDSKFKEFVAAYTRKAWADGKYDGVKTGQCKWYDHIKPNGEIVKLQGTWEVAFARWLDIQNLTYDTHKGRWSYTDSVGVQRSYYPDFYIHEWDTTIDVKGAFWDDSQAHKLDHIMISNPTKKLLIANSQWLCEHNVDYLSVQKELLA